MILQIMSIELVLQLGLQFGTVLPFIIHTRKDRGSPSVSRMGFGYIS